MNAVTFPAYPIAPDITNATEQDSSLFNNRQASPGPFWMVWNPYGHQNPKAQHATKELAEQEARRLSEKHISSVFIVLEAKAWFRAEAKVLSGEI